MKRALLWSGLVLAVVVMAASPAFAGSQQLVAPVKSVLDMVLGVISTAATLALTVGLVAKFFAAHLLSGMETIVNKFILIGLIGQVPFLVGLMNVTGAVVP